MVLRRIFGPRRDEVTLEWRRLHNEELNDLYSSPNIVRVIKSRRMRWARHVERMGEERVVYRILLGKPEGRRPLGRSRHRWVDNIRMDLQEVGCGYMDWIGLAQDRDRWRKLVSAVMNRRVQWNAGNFLTSCKPVSCSRRILLHGVSQSQYEGVCVWGACRSVVLTLKSSLAAVYELSNWWAPSNTVLTRNVGVSDTVEHYPTVCLTSEFVSFIITACDRPHLLNRMNQ